MNRFWIRALVCGATALTFLCGGPAALADSTSDYNDPSGGGIPGGFIFFMVLIAAAGIGGTIWRVSMARSMARRSGNDPDEATAVTLLTPNGLDAAYLAANLRPHSDTAAPAPRAPHTVEQRLRELTQLRDDGLITSTEYDARRQKIIDSV